MWIISLFKIYINVKLDFDPFLIHECVSGAFLFLLGIYLYLPTCRAFMAGAASQAGDADSSRAPGLTSGLQGSVNVHRGALLLVPQWQYISSFVFYLYEPELLRLCPNKNKSYLPLPQMSLTLASVMRGNPN